MHDDYGSASPLWMNLTKEDAENPLPAIYRAEIAVHDKETQISEATSTLTDLRSRLNFLRGVLRKRMGEEPTP